MPVTPGSNSDSDSNPAHEAAANACRVDGTSLPAGGAKKDGVKVRSRTAGCFVTLPVALAAPARPVSIKFKPVKARTSIKLNLPPPPPPPPQQQQKETSAAMAPASTSQDVGSSMKTVIQNMFDVSQTVVGFVPESQNLLADRVEDLAENIRHLTELTNPDVSPDNAVHDVRIAPEIVDYVDDGRNPDIFSRDFVERVQRGNMVMKGKQEAFRSFAQIFARELKAGIGGIEKQVDQVMENAGIEQLAADGRDGKAENDHGPNDGGPNDHGPENGESK